MIVEIPKYVTDEDSLRVYKIIGKGQILNFGRDDSVSEEDVIVIWLDLFVDVYKILGYTRKWVKVKIKFCHAPWKYKVCGTFWGRWGLVRKQKKFSHAKRWFKPCK